MEEREETSRRRLVSSPVAFVGGDAIASIATRDLIVAPRAHTRRVATRVYRDLTSDARRVCPLIYVQAALAKYLLQGLAAYNSAAERQDGRTHQTLYQLFAFRTTALLLVYR